MTVADRIRVKNVRVLSDNHYTLKTTTFEWRRANGEWQTQHRETYDRGNGATLLPYNLAQRTVVLVRQFRYPAYVNSVRSSRPMVVRSRWPCSMLVNLARLVFSQSCSVFTSVVRRRLPIMVLMLSLSSATSPRASTWIERVRSPLVTAVATSAMARTCEVRLAASRLTLPVRSFQVPAAPGTFA